VIDVHSAAVAIHDANLTGGKPAAIRAVTKVLADCWDDCAAVVAPNGRGIDNPNPYRLALELAPDSPHAPAVEFVDEPVNQSEPERDTRQRHLFITTVDDAELIAMQIIVQALDGLDQRAQNRVITYISERMA
jgi:hypothetical protein